MDRDDNLAEKLREAFTLEFYPDTPGPFPELEGREKEYWEIMLRIAKEVLNGQR